MSDESKYDKYLQEINESKIKDLHFIISNHEKRENNVIKSFSIFTSTILVIVAVFQGATFYQVGVSTERIEKRSEKILDNTEKQLDQLFNNSYPESSYVDTIYNDKGRYITGTVSIVKNQRLDKDLIDTYLLVINIPAKIFIRGKSSAKLLGYEYKISKELPEILYEDLDSEVKNYFVSQYLTYNYNSITNDGVMISPHAGINISIDTGVNREKCEMVELKLNKIISARQIGTVTIKPVLENASTQIRVEENTFYIRFLSKSLFKCKNYSEYIKMNKWKFILLQ